MNPFNVILKPILSEKSTDLREQGNQYTFLVHPDATKDDIANAILKMWNVRASKVRTIVRRGKIKRRGMHVAKLANTKKAYVHLPEGARLPIFEEQ